MAKIKTLFYEIEQNIRSLAIGLVELLTTTLQKCRLFPCHNCIQLWFMQKHLLTEVA